jgi:polysaccharide biosynthesis transport protein
MSDEPNVEQPRGAGGPDSLRIAFDPAADGVRPVGRYGEAAYVIEPERKQLQHYLGILYKRRWSALTVFLLVLTFAIVRNFTAVPIYQAQVRVLVEAEKVNLVNFQDVIDQRRSLDTELAILRSRWLAARTVAAIARQQKEQGAQASTDPARDRAKEATDWWTRVKTRVGGVFGWVPEAPTRDLGETPSQAALISGFLDGLNLLLNNAGDGVLDIRYRSTDPESAARFANAHAQEYINQKHEARFAALREVTDWLAARLAEQKQKVDASDQALLRFRDQNQLVVPDASPVIVSKINDLTSAVAQAQQVRFDKEAAYQKAIALRANPDQLDTLPQVANDTTLQQLRTEMERLQREKARLAKSYGEKWPDVVKVNDSIAATARRLDAERTRVIEGLREELASARRSETIRAAELNNLRNEATVQNRKGIELSILTREVESNRQIYELFLQRARETGVAREINPIRTRILDAALVPTSPIAPNKQRNLMTAIVFGFGAAFLVAFGFEFLDNRVKTPVDISEDLRLTFLGLVPHVRLDKDAPAGPLASNGVPPEFSEELRRIRTNVLFSVASESSRSLVVTSAAPSEGKTIISSNLAILLAQSGQRVLLIDADMRRPSVHTQFAIAQEPGLSNVLVGNKKASEAVRPSNVPNLWLLPAGHSSPNPSELLGSQRFKNFLVAVREQFDWVLIDTPPVMAVTDACVIAHLVDGTVFVTAAEMVSKQAARRAIEQLLMANARLIGGILNRVDVQRHGYYYASYYQGYGRKYKKYYQSAPS